MSQKDFVVINKLGVGAYSQVYKVQRIVDSQIYALKKVKMNSLNDKQQQNALNEVRILASVKSPYIVGYKHAFIENNSLCIVMQFSDDGDLYQKIVQHQKSHTSFDEETIWKTIVHVTLGLKSLHQLNILHRDLKSANVFLNKDGTAKLGDMNVSKIAKQGLLYTQTGTPYYASPEVWKDKPYDSKSDIWSLGCVIYEMTTLKPPFRAEDMDGLYKKVIKGSYSKIGDGFSKNLSYVIKSMLQVNPSNRPSAAELLRTLAPKAEQMGIRVFKQDQNNMELLKTIYANKNLHYLTDRLPKSNYQNGHEYEKVIKLNQSSKSKYVASLNGVNNNLRNINLPKLDRVIKNKNPVKSILSNSSEEAKKYNADITNMLKIEGKNHNNNSNNIVNPLYGRYDYQYQQSKKAIDREIKAQLRKIYNLKPSPKKPNNRKIQLPKLK